MKLTKEEIDQYKLIAEWEASKKYNSDIGSLKTYSNAIFCKLMRKEELLQKRQTRKIIYVGDIRQKCQNISKNNLSISYENNDPFHKKIFDLLICGYNVKEVSNTLKISQKNIYNSIKKIKSDIWVNIICER